MKFKLKLIEMKHPYNTYERWIEFTSSPGFIWYSHRIGVTGLGRSALEHKLNLGLL